MPSAPPTQLCRRALLGNALFSCTAGATLAVLPSTIATWIQLNPPWVLRAVGLGVLVFSWLVASAGTRPRLRTNEVLLVSLADCAWVLGTALLLTRWPATLNATGQAAAVAIASVVAGFAIAQVTGLKRYLAETGPDLDSSRGCLAGGK